LILIFMNSCQSVQDGLTGKKRSESNDEFFVIKKNPLTMPPDFDKLPTPAGEENNIEENDTIKELLGENPDNNESTPSNTSKSLENSILEKINE